MGQRRFLALRQIALQQLDHFAQQGVALGQGAIMPLLNMSAICIAIVMIVAVLSLLLLRLRSALPAPGYSVPGGLIGVVAGFIGIGFLGGVAIYEPLAGDRGRLPVDFMLLITWIVLGAGVWLAKARRLRAMPRADLQAILLHQEP